MQWHSPHPIKEAEIIYADVGASRLSADAKMIGGVIRPASIAKACCNPLVIATSKGRSSLSA